MLIRDCQPTDAEEVEALRIAAWRAGFSGLLPESRLAALTADPNLRRAQTLQRRSLGGTELVAVDGIQIVGWISGGVARDPDLEGQAVKEIYACYVHPDHWRGGIARELMQRSVAGLEQSGTPAIVGWVLSRNAKILALATSLGFTPDGSERLFEGSKEGHSIRLSRRSEPLRAL